MKQRETAEKQPVESAQTERTTDSERAFSAGAGNELLGLQTQRGNRYVQDVVAQSRRSEQGRSMPMRIRSKMEKAFHTDFSDVQIHEGHEAASLDALAYTQGSHIYFRPGEYQPNSITGQWVLGHELTHVVQQRAGRVAMPTGKGAPINTDAGLEREADQMSQQVVQGHAVDVATGFAGPASDSSPAPIPAPIQRWPKWMKKAGRNIKRFARYVTGGGGGGAPAPALVPVVADVDQNVEQSEASSQHEPAQEGDAWANLYNREDVYFRDGEPLTVKETHAILARIAGGDPHAVAGLSTHNEFGGFGETPATRLMGEWGIAARGDEAFIIEGGDKGVDWDEVIKAGGSGVAHSHPYPGFGDGFQKRAIGDDPNSYITFEQLMQGEVPNAQMMVLPSNSDIVFAARYDVPLHTVFTPYVVAFNAQKDQWFVTNPRSKLAAHVRQQEATSTLNFEIHNAEDVDGRDQNFRCTLVAKASTGKEIWRGEVEASAKFMKAPPMQV